MRLKVKVMTLIQKCEARLVVLRARQTELQKEQETGAWRTELRSALHALGHEATDTEISGEEISSKLYELRAIAKAEGVSTSLYNVEREIKKVERIQTLLSASSADGYMVDTDDPILMTIMNPESQDE